MATAGQRYDVLTGNIWSYAHRGDLTGLKAALARGVDVNLVNTVGWTACHAAAAGGRCKALRLLARHGADLTIADRGGDLPVHHAAKNGHVHALRTLDELGGDATKVRLSQAKGKAARDYLGEAYRKSSAAKTGTDDGEEEGGREDSPAVVGYARRQSKSTALWGPRRTPISCKIKKKIIKDKRKARREQNESARANDENEPHESEGDGEPTKEPDDEPLTGYIATVKQIKLSKKQKRRHNRARRNPTEEKEDDDVREAAGAIGTMTENVGSTSESSDEDEDQANGFTGSRFAALTLLDGDSD